jgi:hypothetical protein
VLVLLLLATGRASGIDAVPCREVIIDELQQRLPDERYRGFQGLHDLRKIALLVIPTWAAFGVET